MVIFVADERTQKMLDELKGTRTAKQIYGLLLAEPPHMIGSLSQLNNTFNWTITYRSDGDVKRMLGTIVDKETGEDVRFESQKWREFSNHSLSAYVRNSEIPGIVAGKTKMIAWFVSNCHRVNSGRMKLAKAINESIPLDIYGRCGQLNCSGAKTCDSMLEKDYKFYLSFENALCTDYISEKAFRGLNKMIIPVLYNGVNVSKILPPHSYINVDDFESVKELTDYLTYLSNNPEEYMKYFWWKEFYTYEKRHYSCDLCKKLNSWDRSKTIATHPDIDTWYNKDACRAPTQFKDIL